LVKILNLAVKPSGLFVHSLFHGIIGHNKAMPVHSLKSMALDLIAVNRIQAGIELIGFSRPAQVKSSMMIPSFLP